MTEPFRMKRCFRFITRARRRLHRPSLVEVGPGQTARIDFQSSRVPVHRVGGRITGGSVESGGGSTVRLVPINSNGAQQTFPDDYLDLESLIEGNSFEIGGVPPGSYAVLADFHRDGISMSARTTIDVRNADVNELVVAPTPNVRITGNFLIDGDTNDGKSSSASAQLQLRSKTVDADTIASSVVRSVLTFDNVPAGDYFIDLFFATLEIPGKTGSSPAYIESIRAGGQDVLQNGLHVDSSFDQPLRIVVRNDFGSVSGRVTGSSPQFPEPVVVLSSQPSGMILPDTKRREWIQRVSFTSRTLHLATTKSLLPVSSITIRWQDPEFVTAHEVYGRNIRVSAGNDQTVDVPYIMGDPK